MEQLDGKEAYGQNIGRGQVHWRAGKNDSAEVDIVTGVKVYSWNAEGYRINWWVQPAVSFRILNALMVIEAR